MGENASEIIRMPNITPVRERAWYKTLIISSGLILFGILAFGLGRLSKIEENKPDLVITQTAQAIQALQITQTKSVSGGEARAYVASKSGTKYYLPACAGVSRIKEENKIWFATKAEAEARGLSPASNCPGL
ncbi:MAG TPA: hypothetical protein VJK09_02360 [Candidatus Paceibacterota bacterium]